MRVRVSERLRDGDAADPRRIAAQSRRVYLNYTRRMREAIDAVAKNRTMIVIAHRLSTVIDSDQIIVMQDGKILGTGTHKQLLKSTPLYKELAATQMLD